MQKTFDGPTHPGRARGPSPTQVLRDEHVLILQVVAVLERILDPEYEAGELDLDGFADCVSFIRLYADACHHGKEEDLLFPELEAGGMPRGVGPIAVMLQEHEIGRALARTMADQLERVRGGDRQAMETMTAAASSYVMLIRNHILKEDNVLFNMADDRVVGPACLRLCDAYDVVCQRRFEGCTKAELEGLAARLAARYPD